MILKPLQLADWREGRPWATNLLLCLLGVALLLFTRQFLSEYDHFTIGFSGCSGWSVVIYLAAAFLVLTQPTDSRTLPIILGFAIAFRAMLLFAEPYASSDIYRYVWDGIVQHAHINPYRYVPGNPALSFLREPYKDIYESINRRDYAPTIYPPVAQMIYWLVTFFSPTVDAMKAAMFVFECLTMATLLAILKRLGRPLTDVLLYAWAPLLVWEFGGAGHVDAAILAFVSLALLFRLREKPVLVGLFIGLAIMTKFYPFILLPALYKRGDWKMPATVLAVMASGYAVYASVGMRVFGFLGSYQKEEGIESGTRFFLLDWAHSHRWGQFADVHAFLLFSAVLFGGLTFWAWRHATTKDFHAGVRPGVQPAVLRSAAMLSFAMMLLFSPHYPWYVAWLFPLLTLVPTLPMLTYLCAVFYGFTTQWADPGPKFFLLNTWIYGGVLVASVLHLLLRRYDLYTRLHGTLLKATGAAFRRSGWGAVLHARSGQGSQGAEHAGLAGAGR